MYILLYTVKVTIKKMYKILLFVLAFLALTDLFIVTECKNQQGHQGRRAHRFTKGHNTALGTLRGSTVDGPSDTVVAGDSKSENGSNKNKMGNSKGNVRGVGPGGVGPGGIGPGGRGPGGGSGFMVGKIMVLKHQRSGMCIYPLGGETVVGTELQIQSERCNDDLSRYVPVANGIVEQVQTGLCMKGAGDDFVDNDALILSDDCKQKTALFEMTPFGSLKLQGSDYCVQPSTTDGESGLVIRQSCDTSETRFIVFNVLHAAERRKAKLSKQLHYHKFGYAHKKNTN